MDTENGPGYQGIPPWEIALFVIGSILCFGVIFFICIVCMRKLLEARKKKAKYEKLVNRFSLNYKTHAFKPVTHVLKKQDPVDYGYHRMPPDFDAAHGSQSHRDGHVCHDERDLRECHKQDFGPKSSKQSFHHNGSDNGRSDRSPLSARSNPDTPTHENLHPKAYFTWSTQSSFSEPNYLFPGNGKKDLRGSGRSRSPSPTPESRSRTPTPPSPVPEEEDIYLKSARSMSNEGLENTNLLAVPKLKPRSFSMADVRHLQDEPPPGMANKWKVHTMPYKTDPTKSHSDSKASWHTTLTFSIAYHSSRKSLELIVDEVIGIPSRFGFDCSSFTQVSLLPKTRQKLYTGLVKGTRNPPFNETFFFADVTPDDLERCSLRLRVYIKEPGKSRDTFLGEVFFLLSQGTWTEELQSYTQTLNKGRRKKVSTASRYMKRELGELFILLQYQSQASRLKVFVRRAQNLPGADKRSILSPEYYVSVKLSHKTQILEVKGTHSRHGQNPVWNEPFLFNITETLRPENLTLDFSVMKVHTYSKDAVIGHVRIGMVASKAGIAHWQETLMPRGLDTAKWHKIVPVVVYGDM